jgi:hypothetical protein
MTAEPGSWWLVLLGGMAGQAARVAEADRARAALLATVSLRRLAYAARECVPGHQCSRARPTQFGRYSGGCADGL